MENILEVLMVVCFGISWPINIIKAWKARSTKGSSVFFYFFIWIGYIFGLCSKYVKLLHGVSSPGYIWFFYLLNTAMVTAGIVIYYRNWLLEQKGRE